MDLLLTDRLVCPRCGPPFGLVLLANELDERRVHEGRLGCSNCRHVAPVAGGFADLRPPPLTAFARPVLREEPDEEGALRTAALLGLADGAGHALLLGARAASLARAVARRTGGVEWVAADAGLREADEAPGVSRVAVGTGLPFHDRSLRALALGGEGAELAPAEAARVLRPGSRLLILEPAAHLAAGWAGAGFETGLEEGGVRLLERR